MDSFMSKIEHEKNSIHFLKELVTNNTISSTIPYEYPSLLKYNVDMILLISTCQNKN